MHIWFKHIKQECIKHAMICFYIIWQSILNLPYAKLHCLLLLAKAMSVLIMSGGDGTACSTRDLSTGHIGTCAPAPLAILLHWPWRLLSSFSHIFLHISLSCRCAVGFFFFFFFMNSALPGSGVAALASSGSLSEPAGVVSDLK